MSNLGGHHALSGPQEAPFMEPEIDDPGSGQNKEYQARCVQRRESRLGLLPDHVHCGLST